MAYAYSELLVSARQWAQTALAEGRLSAECGGQFDSLDDGRAEPLFNTDVADDNARPLIVAFMGGTGVGKSSLLNRLAGQAIARAGIERPTSREVTLYHHQSLALQALPVGLPLDSVKISQHSDAGNSHIVWIDMPDFDSVELANQRQVLQWLPCIDVLVYVVSPERYRDNKAWQLLLAEGAKHAWLFVMNQWDRGQPLQYDDFKRQLARAGFDDPIIFRTSCSEQIGDEFGDLVQQLQQLSGSHTIAQLDLRGERWRRQQLKLALQRCESQVRGQDFSRMRQQLALRWQNFSIELTQGLAWTLQQHAQYLADHLGQKSDYSLWDDWAQSRFSDFLDELVQHAGQCRISVKALKSALHGMRDGAEKNIASQCELTARQAMLKPGNGLQRFLLNVTAVCETLLPLVAMAVVGYQVLAGYYHSAADATAYLGTDFAVHSVLLIALSWSIPFFLHKKLQPSVRKVAYRGLLKGLHRALADLEVQLGQILQDEQRRQEQVNAQLLDLISRCEDGLLPAEPVEKALSRVLVNGAA